MPQCPDCKTNNVQSKGYRTKGVHRYLCNECGRNFTVDTRTKEKTGITLTMTEGETIKPEQEVKNMTSIAVSVEVRTWLESLKLVKQEPINSVLERIKNKE